MELSLNRPMLSRKIFFHLEKMYNPSHDVTLLRRAAEHALPWGPCDEIYSTRYELTAK
jgi:hypothetical protein